MEQVGNEGVFSKIKSFILQSKRVWHVLKKPSKEEFLMVAKVSAIGILALGALGFIISDIIKLFS
ncbi:MAG: protein translocase SEC61 complex subunit gamma [Nanoarchaeota archaeon]|nr:protein translocase SEC61 complex subunit gamma [Nanoarchaeota archaeon]